MLRIWKPRIFLTIIINLEVFITFVFGNPYIGFGISQNHNIPTTKQSFMEMMAKVPINIDDIEEMYRNVTKEAMTWGCIGKCRTPVALWVTQSIAPCQDILKEDCPKGLVCCKNYPTEKPIRVGAENVKRSDISVEINDSEWDESKFDAMSFHQDPIPGER